MLEAIVFDFDGVLIDTEMPHYQVWLDFYQSHQLNLSLDLWRKRIGAANGAHPFDPALHFMELTGRQLDQAVIKELWDDYIARCQTQPLLPGVRSLVEEAQAQGIRLGIASNGYHWWITQHLNRLSLNKFDCIVTLEDVEHGKPAPDVYLKAVSCLGVSKEHCIAIEDSPTGMTSALAAGLHVLGVLTPLTAALPYPDISLVATSLEQVDLTTLLTQF